MSRTPKQKLDPAIHRVRLDKITIYDITESELEAIERGSPESTLLNLGIAVLSIAVSFSIALATTDIASTKTFCVFVSVTAIGNIAAVALLLVWWRMRGSTHTVAAAIRNRNVPEGVQESGDTESDVA